MTAFTVHNPMYRPFGQLPRHFTIVTSAATVSLLLFYGMSKLVAPAESVLVIRDDMPVIEIAQLPPEKPPVQKQVLPEKPQPPAPPPAREPLTAVGPDTVGGLPVDIVMPPIQVNNGGIDSAPVPEQDAAPVVRMEPKYPVDAARNGIQGWVELSFSIDALGQVQDVKVTNSEPRRVFDQAAMQALKRWKYRPKVVEGKAIVQTGLAVRLDFNLEQQ